MAIMSDGSAESIMGINEILLKIITNYLLIMNTAVCMHKLQINEQVYCSFL